MKTNSLKILLKKQFTESFSFFKRGKKKFDFLGAVFAVVLFAAIMSAFYVVFSRFLKIYLNVTDNGELIVGFRQWQMLSVSYFFITLTGVFSAMNSLSYEIFQIDDLKVMSALPLSSNSIFWAKLIIVYLKQIRISFCTVLPVNIAFIGVVPQQWSFYLLTVLACFVLPLLSLIIASPFTLPYYYVKRFILGHFILSFAFLLILTLGASMIYSAMVDALKYLIVNGEIRFIFNDATMSVIGFITKIAYPSNFLVNMLTLNGFWLNLIFLIMSFLGIGAAAYFIIKALLQRAMRLQSVSIKSFLRSKKLSKKKNAIFALIKKEYNNILRTPSYTFQFFALSISLPAMVFLCTAMGEAFLKNLIFANASTELALTLTLIFSVLTNIFCATNVSRDGENFFTAKAMPLSVKSIVYAKIFVCFVNAFSFTLISVLALAIFGYISVAGAAYIFLNAVLFAISQICFATRLDFNRPAFSKNEDGVVREIGTTVSTVLTIGLLTAGAIGVLAIVAKLGNFFKLGSKAFLSAVPYLVPVFAALLAAGSVVFLIIGLQKRYKKFEEG